MIISSIVNKEKVSINSRIKILWTPSNKEFEHFVSKLNVDLVQFEQIYYGNSFANIIVCNNKIDYYNQCFNLSRRLHLPVLLIDHNIKNSLFDNEKIKTYDYFPCMHHVCISKTISDSWSLNNTQILSYNHQDKDNISVWQNLLYQISKKVFKI